MKGKLRVRRWGIGIIGAALLAGGTAPPLWAEKPDILWHKVNSTLESTQHSPLAIRFSPDGQRFAAIGPASVEIRRTSDRALLFTLHRKGEEGPGLNEYPSPMEAAFTSDGEGIVTRYDHETFQYWRANDGTLLNTLTVEGLQPTLSPDGRFAVAHEWSGDSRTFTVRVWRVRNGQLTATLSGLRAWTLSTDSPTLFAVTSDRALRFIRLEDGSVRREIPASTFPAGAFDQAATFFVSPDETLITLSGEDRTELRRLSDGGLIQSFPEQRYGWFSPGGQILVMFGMDGRLSLWRPADGGTWVPAFEQLAPGGGYAFSPDGRFLAGKETEEGPVKVWCSSDGQLVRTFASTGTPLTFSPDGEILAIRGPAVSDELPLSGAQPTGFWRVSDGQEIPNPERFVNATALAFSPDGQTLAVGGREVQLWRSREGTLLRSWPKGSGDLLRLAFSPDGQTLRGETFDKVRVWRTSDGTLLSETERPFGPTSPDGQLLAFGPISEFNSKPIEIRRAGDHSLVRSLSQPGRALIPLAFTPDGAGLVVKTYDLSDPSRISLRSFDLWSVAEGRFLRTVASVPEDLFAGVLDSESDGQTLAFLVAVADRNASPPAASYRLTVVSVADGAVLYSDTFPYVQGIQTPFVRLNTEEEVSLPADPRFLDVEKNLFLIASPELRSLNLRELTTGRVLQTFTLREGEYPTDRQAPLQAHFTPDRKTLVTNDSRRLTFWNVETGHRIAEFDEAADRVNALRFSPDGALMAYDRGQNALVMATHPAAGGFIHGDVNASLTVDVQDAVLTLRFITELASPSEREKRAADMNRDTFINISDAILILRRAVGLDE